MNPFLTVLLCIATVSANAQAPNGAAIIAKMGQRYATLRSYQDTGVVKASAPSKDAAELRFKTYFVRPTQVRFEWIDYWYPAGNLSTSVVLWCNPNGAFTYLGGKSPSIGNGRDICWAIAGATGISRGSAHTIPRLLLPTIGGLALTDFKEFTYLEQVEFESVPCFRIRATRPGHTEMWVGVEDFLLRKVQLGNQDEIHRDIQVDVDIPEETFYFEPPK